MTCWFTTEDGLDTALSQIIYGECNSQETPDPVQRSLAQAALDASTSILSRASGFMVHGPGSAVDQFIAVPSAHRLSLNFGPVQEIISVLRNGDPVSGSDLSSWALRGSSIYFDRMRGSYGAWVRGRCGSSSDQDVLNVEYSYRSTVSMSAVGVAVYYASQLYSACSGGECELPDRIVSVTREGLTFQMIDPLNYLNDGRTGIPRVDQWLTSVNRSGGMRKSGVWTPDSPPAVNLEVSCLPLVAVP